MKIYMNANYEILSLDIPPSDYEHVEEVDQARSEMFGSLCDACVCGYRYEPAYEMLFNEDGSNKRDEKTGTLLYKTDGEGGRVRMGWQCYPFVDVRTIQLVQKQHEASQSQLNDLTCTLADVIGGALDA